jgi:hypothetical protein
VRQKNFTYVPDPTIFLQILQLNFKRPTRKCELSGSSSLRRIEPEYDLRGTLKHRTKLKVVSGIYTRGTRKYQQPELKGNHWHVSRYIL